VCHRQPLPQALQFVPDELRSKVKPFLGKGLLLPIWHGSHQFSGVFAKLRKVTVRFIMSVHPHGTTQLQLDGFS
jgi:hypothetical protein